MRYMELQLRLALPSNSVKGFDLNSYFYEPNENMGSDPSWNDFGLGSMLTNCCTNDICVTNKIQSFDEAFERDEPLPRTLTLLQWNKQPNDEEDPRNLEDNSSFDSKKRTDEDGAVGWPPIKTWRKKLAHQHHGGRACGSRRSNSLYVKVKMEGLAIARKIDLSLYDSVQTLKTTLISMFDIWHEDSNSYKLAYQDKEGDWLIAQDVPWRTFIRTVQRLKLLKISN